MTDTIPRRGRRGVVRAVSLGAAVATALVGAGVAGPAAANGGHGGGGHGGHGPSVRQPAIESRGADILTIKGLKFRDLDGSGTLTPYEDWRLTPQKRAADVVSRLSLEEKAGQLVHGSLTGQGTYNLAAFTTLLKDRHVTTYISRLSTDSATLASQHNLLQEAAEGEKFGIPLKISTDPRNGFSVTQGQTVSNGDFTPFPNPIGLGAVGDPKTTRAMADLIRKEYRAVGITEGLSPQADIATEPRWTRIDGTYGSTGKAAKAQVAAYVAGLQGGTRGLTSDSVAAVVKHWVGYGAQVNGYDSHYYYGRYAAFPGNNFAEHIVPFTGALAVDAAGVMPTYSILKDLKVNGQTVEQVGAGHNEFLLQTLLKQKYKFDGVITSDWGIVNNCPAACLTNRPPASFIGPWGAGMPWGVEDLTLPQRYASTINAGVDIIGGTDTPQYIVDAVNLGYLTVGRVNQAARAVLAQKFELGLFEDPFVDPQKAARTVGSDRSIAFGQRTQERSLTLLTNTAVAASKSNRSQTASTKALPLKNATGKKVFLYGVAADAAVTAGMTPVTDVMQADVAIIRLTDPRGGADLTDLNFAGTEADYKALVAASKSGATTIAVPNLTRPLILGNVVANSDAVLANYGVSDTALLNVITGKAKPQGTLPFELPSSMAEVATQLSDVPNDTANPLFDYGFGLSYGRTGHGGHGGHGHH